MKASWMVATLVLASACGGGASGGGGEDRAHPAREVPGVRTLASVSDARAAAVPAAVNDSPVDKIDLLLMIDNSISMSDKQQILSKALPDLMSRLVNPLYIDDQGNLYPPPAEGSTLCPDGQRQEFQP